LKLALLLALWYGVPSEPTDLTEATEAPVKVMQSHLPPPPPQ